MRKNGKKVGGGKMQNPSLAPQSTMEAPMPAASTQDQQGDEVSAGEPVSPEDEDGGLRFPEDDDEMGAGCFTLDDEE